MTRSRCASARRAEGARTENEKNRNNRGQSDCFRLHSAVFEAENTADAKEALLRLAEDEEYAIIFIVDRYARELEEEINKYSGRKTPAITVLPDALSREGELSFGMMRIKRNVERAVGADILFRD